MYEDDSSFWIKFVIVCIPFLGIVWWMAPTLKWKLIFSIAVPVGTWLALSGRSMKGLTPLSRSGY